MYESSVVTQTDDSLKLFLQAKPWQGNIRKDMENHVVHAHKTLRIKKNKGSAFQNYDDKYMCMEFCENICFSTNLAESKMLEFAIFKV